MNNQPVLVTTEKRGVFFGYMAEDHAPEKVTLYRARCCVRWSADCKGFLGLAASGPTGNCRIGPAAEELTLYGVTSVTKVSESAVQAWEAAPWKA